MLGPRNARSGKTRIAKARAQNLVRIMMGDV
jgi:hypothetical protein